MAKKVIISPLAEINYENIIQYLMFKWGIGVTNDFIQRFNEVCGYLEGNAEIYVFVNKEKQIQKCVLTEQNTLFFRESDNIVEILMIFDNWQNPQKLLDLLNDN